MLVIVNSKDRISGTPSNFRYELTKNKLNVKSFRINKVTVPFSWYNQPRQTFTVNTILFTLAEGSYSIYSLISALHSEVQGTFPNFTITYNADKNKVSINDTIALTIVFNGRLGQQLGFENSIGPSVSLTSTNTVNLALTSNIYIYSQSLSTYMTSFFQKKQDNIIQNIPVAVNTFNYVVWQNQMETMFALDSQNLFNFDIRLLDDYGSVIELNGQNIIIEIQIQNAYL